jgi:DNA-directed RNA polymerase specialized sigma24 family protein
MEGFTDEPPDPDPDGSLLADDVARHPDGADVRTRKDEWLVLHFREHGFTGAVWDTFRTRFLGYGLGFVTPLILSGAMFSRCRRRGLHLHQQPVLPQDAEELAMDVVQEGFRLFTERGLVQGRWSGSGLALKQYFENACVLSFPNVYRKWQRARRDWDDVELLDAWTGVERYMSSPSPEDVVVGRAVVDSVFEHVGEDAGAVLFLADQNYTYAEMAEILRLTPRAVEGRLRRARRAARASIVRGGW